MRRRILATLDSLANLSGRRRFHFGIFPQRQHFIYLLQRERPTSVQRPRSGTHNIQSVATLLFSTAYHIMCVRGKLETDMEFSLVLGTDPFKFFVVAPVTALLTVFWHSKKTFRQTLLPTILSKLASFGNLCFQNLFRFFEVRWILVKSFSLSFGTTISASVPDFRLLRSCSFRSSSKPRRPSPSLFTDMSFFFKAPATKQHPGVSILSTKLAFVPGLFWHLTSKTMILHERAKSQTKKTHAKSSDKKSCRHDCEAHTSNEFPAASSVAMQKSPRHNPVSPSHVSTGSRMT